MVFVKKLLLLLTTLSIVTLSQGQERSKQDILNSIGTVSKWNAVNYILFTSTSKNSIFKERSFLIDKSSGKVRFDGITSNNVSLVLLFNYKSKVVDKGYINGKLTDSKSPAIPFQEVLTQLFEDTKLLFLPMFIIASHKSNVTINSEKMINSEKLVEINFKNAHNINKQSITGAIYLNTKGDIKEYVLDQSPILVSDIKDVGDGILLPTQFVYKNTPVLTVKFNTVAAFTDIEDDKFTHL